MGFGGSIATCFSKYADFNGRARRSEFWFWQLFVWLTVIVLGTISNSIIGTLLHVPGSAAIAERGFAISLLLFFLLGTFLPSLAVLVRRLHDINFSGWFAAFGVIPFGGLALLIMSVLPGSQGSNPYGPDVSS